MQALILAGGTGTRLRPLAGGATPIAFEPGSNGRSNLARVAAELTPLVDPADMTIVTDRRHGQVARTAVPMARILPEPSHRQTAASIALATVSSTRSDHEVTIALGADHAVDDTEALQSTVEAIAAALAAADAGLPPPLVALTVPPIDARDGFSHVQPKRDHAMRLGERRVYPTAAFHAAPDARRSRELFDSGVTMWLTGIVIWRRDSMLAALERYTPLLTLLGTAHGSEIALRAAYDRLQPLSIDDAVLAGAARDGQLVTCPLDAGWSDRST